MARFQSYWKSVNPPLEGDFSPTKTEQVGYRTVEQQVKSFLSAGQMLNDYRRGVYDFNNIHDDVDDFPDAEDIDPTRKPGFDEIDAQRTLEVVEAEVKRKLKQTKEDVKQSSRQAKVDDGESKSSAVTTPEAS